MKWSLCTATIISSILVDGSLNILNINVLFAIVPSPSMGEFFLQGRVRVTSPFLFQYKSTSLFFFFGLVRGECTSARGVQGKIPNAVNVCFVIILLKCQCVPALVTRSLGRLSISEHFDLVSTRCDRWQMFENYFVIIFSNVNPRTYTQIHTARPPPPSFPLVRPWVNSRFKSPTSRKICDEEG